MERFVHNPWTWQDPLGFVQAVVVSAPARVLECSGQVSFDSAGRTLHPRDMARQMSEALDNLEAVLQMADMTLQNVVKLTTFVTDMEAFLECRSVLSDRMEAAEVRHTHTLVGVSALARPDVVIEFDVVAYA